MSQKPIDRRDFVKSATLLGGVLMVGACKTYTGASTALKTDEPDKGISRVRYSVYSEKGSHLLDVYNQIVGYLKATKHGDKSLWQIQADIHQSHCPHSNWFFLPWHRAYLFYFEEICRDVAANKIEKKSGINREHYNNWTLPYWNWSSKRLIPAAFFDKEHLKEPRAVDRHSHPPADIFSDQALSKVSSNSDFYLFASGPAQEQRGRGSSGLLESSPHNTIHVWVGGQDKAMATFLSPTDPIFWTHHCNIDRLWLEWTRKCMDDGLNFSETLPSKKEGQPLDVDFWRNHDLTQFWTKSPDEKITVKVGDTLDCTSGHLTFTYDTLRGKEPAPTTLPRGGFSLAGENDGLAGPLANKVLVTSSAKISNIKEGFVIDEAKGVLTMKFKVEPDQLSASDKQVAADVVKGLMGGNDRNSSAVLLIDGIQVADEKVARQMLLRFRGAYAEDTHSFDLGTTAFFVHNHAGHGPTVVDLQIDIAPMIASFKAASELEKRIFTITVSAVQVMDPTKSVRMDKKMFTGTKATKVEASIELRQSRKA